MRLADANPIPIMYGRLFAYINSNRHYQVLKFKPGQFKSKEPVSEVFKGIDHYKHLNWKQFRDSNFCYEIKLVTN